MRSPCASWDFVFQDSTVEKLDSVCIKVGVVISYGQMHDKTPNNDGVKMGGSDPTGAAAGSCHSNALGVQHLGLAVLRLAHLEHVMKLEELENMKVGDSFRIGHGAQEEDGCDRHLGIPGAGEMCGLTFTGAVIKRESRVGL